MKEDIVRALYHGTLAVLGFVLLAGTAFAQPSGTDPTIVQIEGGTVRGALANGVISWKGIPYAAPLVGDMRWRNPQPVKPWTGVKETNRFGSSCMQTDAVPKSEDCLTINVWHPAAAPAQPLPVMVWIHGGAMVHGGAPVYPLDAVAAKGVVIVSMNFRLGRFGYFALPALAAEVPNEVRGNYGFMDQLAALLWVRRNIAAFGGDPKQVTIFGESAGGGSVLAHLVSPITRGLFQRAILQSPRHAGTPGAGQPLIRPCNGREDRGGLEPLGRGDGRERRRPEAAARVACGETSRGRQRRRHD
jgi:para-nitrobenzyl esterase